MTPLEDLLLDTFENVSVQLPPVNDTSACVRVTGEFDVNRASGTVELPPIIAKRLNFTKDGRVWPPAQRHTVYHCALDILGTDVFLFSTHMKQLDWETYEPIIGAVVKVKNLVLDWAGINLILYFLNEARKLTGGLPYNLHKRNFYDKQFRLRGKYGWNLKPSINSICELSPDIAVFITLENNVDVYEKARAARKEIKPLDKRYSEPISPLYLNRRRFTSKPLSRRSRLTKRFSDQKDELWGEINNIFDSTIKPSVTNKNTQRGIKESIKTGLYKIWVYR